MLYTSILTKYVALLVSFSSLSFTDINGTTVSMSAFEGKNVLIVNTASGSSNLWQYDSLEALRQKYDTSLVIIAFPSNSFGNESMSDNDIKDYVEIHCPDVILAQKSDVTGENKNSIYAWLANMGDNGMMTGEPETDFYKYLVNREGLLIGAYSDMVDPMSGVIDESIAL